MDVAKLLAGQIATGDPSVGEGTQFRVFTGVALTSATGNVTVTTTNGTAVVKRIKQYTTVTVGETVVMLSINGMLIAIGSI